MCCKCIQIFKNTRRYEPKHDELGSRDYTYETKTCVEEEINPEENQIADEIIESKGKAYDLNTEFNNWKTQDLENWNKKQEQKRGK